MRSFVVRRAVPLLVCFLAGAGPTMAGGSERGYGGGGTYLTLGSEGSGFVRFVAGGGIIAQVNESPSDAHYVRKHVGPPCAEPITLEVGFGLSPAIYRWIADVWEGNTKPQSGVLAMLDAAGAPAAGLAFEEALLTEVTVPALDASREDRAGLALRIAPERVLRVAPGPVGAAGAESDAKDWRSCDFRLEIDGLDCSRIARIEPFTVRQKTVEGVGGDERFAQREPGRPEFPGISATLSGTSAESFERWFHEFAVKGLNGDDRERTGRLYFLSADHRRALARVEFQNLGICGLRRLPDEQGDIGATSKVQADLYCERMSFVCGPSSVEPATPAAPPPPPADGAEPPSSEAAPPSDEAPAPSSDVPPPSGEAPAPVSEGPGTARPPAGDAQIGTVYAVAENDPLSFALLGADYTVSPLTIAGDLYSASAREKLVVLRFRVGNPQRQERFVRGDSVKLSVTDAFGAEHFAEGDWGIAGSREKLSLNMLPGQSIEAFALIRVPARGPVVALTARTGSIEDGPGLRFDLRRKVTPLEPPVADPADRSGSSALEEVPAKPETACPGRSFSFSVEKFASVTTALDGEPPAEGERFLLVTALVKNLSTQGALLRADSLTPVLCTAEGEQSRYAGMLLATSNRRVDLTLRAGAEIRVRLCFTVRSDAPPTTLTISEGDSRAYRFEVP